MIKRFITALFDTGRPMAATIRDVAFKAGTSVAAASHTLNRRSGGSIRVSEETKERIWRAADDLGYVPHPIARSLATGKTHVLGLVLPYSNAFIDQNPFCTHVMHGVFEAAISFNYNLMLFTAVSGEQHSLGGSQRVDGMVLVLPKQDGTILESCRKRGVPCVAVVARAGEIPTVNADDEEGGFLGTNHLIDLGHTKIALLKGTEGVSSSEQRLAGYLRAMAKAGLPIDPRHMVPSGFDVKLGYESMKELLRLPMEDRPTAVFACNDLCANGAMHAIQDAELRVPEDIAVIGYDDTEFCETTRPPLTSVRMSVDELGFTAVRKLVALIDRESVGETDTILPVTLTVRQSSGARRRFHSPEDAPPAHSLGAINK